ncbi:MAG: hypothetical protein KTR24_18335 [Saprospiraceae bacterium]|nr:hypothetical protein [Saprospiraceae bacterium]
MAFIRTYLSTRLRDRRKTLEAIEKTARSRLQHILQVGQQEVPFHATRIRKAAASHFSEIEPTSKTKMMNRITETLNARTLNQLGSSQHDVQSFVEHYHATGNPWFRNHALMAQTTGTSGRRGLFFRTREELAIQNGISFARSAKYPLSEYIRHMPVRRAVVVMANPFSGSGQSNQYAAKQFRKVVHIKAFLVQSETKEIVHDLNAFDPHHLGSFPLHLERLARLQLKGQLQIRPRIIRFGGSALTPQQLDIITEAFPQAVLKNIYAASECAPIANSCTLGNLHWHKDVAMLECVDKNGFPVPKDEFSHHVLLTNLVRTFQPIIRYKLMDSVNIHSAPCACGSPFPVLEVKGRSNISYPLIDNNGERIEMSSIDILKVINELRIIEDYQMNCTKQNRLSLEVIVKGGPQDALQYKGRHHENILHAFQEHFVKNSCEQATTIEVNYSNPDPKKEKHQAFLLNLPEA